MLEDQPIRLNRMNVPPLAASRQMRAYMGALLEVSGMMAGEGFPLNLFMGNFATHLKPKARFPHATLRVGEDGLYFLTEEGRHFFSSRFTGQPALSGQTVTRSEVIEMIRQIVATRASPAWTQLTIPAGVA